MDKKFDLKTTASNVQGEFPVIFSFDDSGENEYCVNMVLPKTTNLFTDRDNLDTKIYLKGELFGWGVDNKEFIKVCKKVIELYESERRNKP